MPKRKRLDEESKESEQALVIIKKRHWNEHLDADADMKFNNDRWTKEEDALLLVCFEGACSALGLTTKEEKETIIIEGVGRRGKNLKDVKQDGIQGGKRFWIDIAENFSDRSVRSVHRRAVRLLHPGNMKGKWSTADISQLTYLVAQHGLHWKLIGAQMGRLPNAVSSEWSLLKQHQVKKTYKTDKKLIKALIKYYSDIKDVNDVHWSALNLRNKTGEECKSRFFEIANSKLGGLDGTIDSDSCDNFDEILVQVAKHFNL